MAEKYTGVKFEAEKVGEFEPSEEEKAEISKLVDLKNIYQEYGFVDENGGNFSFRTNGGFIIKRTGVWISKMQLSDFVKVVDVQSDTAKVFYKGSALPSSECRTHFLVYQKSSTTNCIIHAHASSVANRKDLNDDPCVVPPISYGTPELAKAVSDKAKVMNFVIALGHGVFSFGDTFENTLKILIKNYEKYRPDQGEDSANN